MAVNFLYLSAISTVVSFVGLQWWVFSLVDGIKADGLIDGGEISLKNVRRVLELVLGSNVTVALLVNSVVNLFAFLVLSLKTLFFVQLYPAETRKVLERIVNYVIHKGLFLPLVVPPNTFQTVLWSSWLIILCTLKMFQSLARDRLDRLNASPTATPSKYFRVFSSLLLVLVADTLWIRLCLKIYRSFTSNLFLLLFFEPLSIAFETLQAIMVHGFQLIEIWQRHSVDCGADCLGSLTLFKSASGSLSEWKGIMIRNCGFLLDMLTLSMSLGHYLIIWWLHGMAFHLVDAVLLLNFRALAGATVKRIRGYIRLRGALNSLNGALPDATYEELSAFDDECAICRGPMARAKKLSCNHLFHLACLRLWLDQGMADVYSCPTCRRPLFLSNFPDSASSIPVQGINNDRLTEEVSMGLHARPLPVGLLPNQQQNPSDAMWRGGGFESSWVPPWPNTGMDSTATSSSVRSVGLGDLIGYFKLVPLL
ncbi:E3 ubiquitin protein ligase RIN2-like isoform X1 [Asparagus officinalis]|uniref:E3 ubiquitin protein ligase RIN2-like isoform X1 n=1 Tax=Asparagus officinalis TaxID=4686 RepID=UPI00098E5F57|nr:E3 ubiquitin protein ligase RIN2-like isoform X1 [Asparagus officinalis]